MKTAPILDTFDDLLEVFGTGTAAVISPVGILTSEDKEIIINQNKIGPVATDLYKQITDIQYGLKPDAHNWLLKI